jgi:TetR/AcrR family transcriptional regulator, mexCD-oprJ operon repressor
LKESQQPTRDHRRAVAERNVGAILGAAERLLERGAEASIAAVAAEAGVSRVTVYAHFPTRERLLEAVVERSVQTAGAAMDAARPDHGPAIDALDRLLAAGWGMLARHDAIARTAATQLSSDVLRDLHHSILSRVRRLAERGREDGSFREDVPIDWLVACVYALIHAAADEVRAGRMDPDAALEVLRTTMREVFVGGG